MDNYISRLYDKDDEQIIEWTLHTTMTCDVSTVFSLLTRQTGLEEDNIRREFNKFASSMGVFYDSGTEDDPKEPSYKIFNKSINVKDIKKYMLFPVSRQEGILHAKISLVCFSSRKDSVKEYRLAVYSRNMEFNDSCAETALIFDLKKSQIEGETESGRQLISFFRTLFDRTSETGREWLEKHGLGNENGNTLEELACVTLVSEFGKVADLYFGGCTNKTLGERLRLNEAEGIVITPPEFMRDKPPQKYFEENHRVKLYDLKLNNKIGRTSSHIKLFLLKKDDVYELWMGSANATVPGLGWNFQLANSFSVKKVNIECLIRFTLTDDEFKDIFDGICEEYEVFDFSQKGTLQHPEVDNFGSYFCSCYSPLKIEYLNAQNVVLKDSYRQCAKSIKVYFKKTGNLTLSCQEEKHWIWRPAEYNSTKALSHIEISNIENGKDVELIYDLKKFQSASGIFCFGSSGSIMEVPLSLYGNVPVENTELSPDIRLTSWLLGETVEVSNFDNPELQWIKQVLNEENPDDFVTPARRPEDKPIPLIKLSSLPSAKESYNVLKPVQMKFQRNASAQLTEILSESSRAFLADEAGLGKTYSSAGVICTLAKKQWNEQCEKGEIPTPFFALYVAPNRDLLKKNCEDIIEKCREDLLNKDSDIKIYSIYEIFDEFCKTVKGHNEYREFCINEPDRIVFAKTLLQLKPVADAVRGKTIVLLPSSINMITGDSGKDAEWDVILKSKFKSRSEYIKSFLREYQPGIILWDEYHRYNEKVKRDNVIGTSSFRYIKNEVIDWEIESHKSNSEYRKLKSLFISATPYPAPVSKENESVLERLYSFGEDEKIEELPSFDDFTKLFLEGIYGNYTRDVLNSEEGRKNLKNRHRTFLNFPGDINNRTVFQDILKTRMVRHERTRLQNVEEEHYIRYAFNTLYRKRYWLPLKNIMKQGELLRELGYTDGAVKWSWNMPWILSFSSKDRRIYIKDGKGNRQKDILNYFELLTPSEHLGHTCAEKLFVYNDEGNPKECLRELPNQNLAFAQICDINLSKEMAQLLWVPPTVPLYKPEGIYMSCKDYSKLLVFAEYRYLQRGGACLLSDYCKLLNSRPGGIPEQFPPELKYAEVSFDDFCLTNYDSRNLSLDELIERIREMYPAWENEKILAAIASPAACARRIEKVKAYVNDVENWFNNYFARDGVKEALWAWITDNGYSDEKSWEIGILRYCAEGNLYAVLEEYSFLRSKMVECFIPENPKQNGKKQYVPGHVYVQTLESTCRRQEGKVRVCSYADRLTGDNMDIGSGDNVDVRTAAAKSFSSPFWPMILFAGRGAQEGMDFHEYCLRLMHLTLPRGPVAFDQRQGRIDRFRSLLVRRRAAEIFEESGISCGDDTSSLLTRIFAGLINEKTYRHMSKDENQLFPNWSIPKEGSRHHFERLLPFWNFTEEGKAANICVNMLASYRTAFGVRSNGKLNECINLSAPDREN